MHLNKTPSKKGWSGTPSRHAQPSGLYLGIKNSFDIIGIVSHIIYLLIQRCFSQPIVD